MAATASVVFPSRAKGMVVVSIASTSSRCFQFVKPCTVAPFWATLASSTSRQWRRRRLHPQLRRRTLSLSLFHLIMVVRL
jgi:hypothetical protein